MITYQKDVKKSSAAKCGRGDFWKEVKSQKTAWHIDARRAVKAAVAADKEGEGVAAIHTWLQNSDYQKFLIRYPKELKSKRAIEAFAKKSDEEKLLLWAEELKQELTAFMYSCYLFDEVKRKKKKKDGTVVEVKERRRLLKYCHLNGLVMLDIDHVESPMQIWYKLREMKDLMARVALVHISCSGDGLRIVFTADINVGNLADNQIEFAKALGGYSSDRSTIDSTRASFCPKEDEILYINEELLFDYYDEEFDKRFTPEYRQKRTQPLFHKFGAEGEKAAVAPDREPDRGQVPVRNQEAQLADRNLSPCQAQAQCDENAEDSKSNLTWRGYDLQSIIDQRYADRLPCAADSNRHNESLKLATDLMLMLDGDKALVQQVVEAQPWVQEIIEERGEDVEQTVESAAGCIAEKEKKYASSLPSKAMQEAIKAACGRNYQEIIRGDKETGRQGVQDNTPDINQKLDGWGMEIESMFDDFPMLRDICKGLKRTQYTAAVFVAGGVLMTLMTRCWYRFYHRPQQERRLNCALFVIGNPASNKSMAGDICDVLIAPIEEADKAGKAALNRYKRDMKKKSANKEGKDKPQGIIRIHPARTSNGQMIEDMINAKEIVDGKEMQLHLFTFDTELDNSITLQGGGSWINKQAMELKAFHNEKDGQMYQNSDSPVDEFPVIWNYEYTGTDLALQKKVNERNFGTGLSTRLAVIPMPKTNYEMIEFEEQTQIDWERINRMKDWAYKLDARAGELPLWPLVKRIYDWTKNRMDDCREDDSEANELMLKRVPYHALNYSAPFIDMRHWDCMQQEGKYWKGTYEVDDTDWKLCELIARIQYATQQYFFGALAEKYFDDLNGRVQISGKRHYNKSVEGYNKLPDVFTKEDVTKCFGYTSTSSIKMKIMRLENESIIERITEGSNAGKYKKLVKILN
jgi:hypothetical protein